jgi:hypothetical protein
MRRRKFNQPDLFSDTSAVKVNYGKLLEDQLKKWQGGSQHVRGIAEYISNCDDSYRRKRKFQNQEIFVEIHSKRGRKIDKLAITDYAEGMNFEDLENKFFQYFESYSGRKEGLSVTGQFGTGGKAYAIMNFKECWITSVKNNLECKAWFKWDSNRKEIIKGYNGKGYKNRPVEKQNGTTVELVDCHKNNIELTQFIINLNSLARIRHVIKSQHVHIKVFQRENISDFILEYSEPNNPTQIWTFDLTDELKNENSAENKLTLRYFEKPINEHSFIDVSDGISSVADIEISKIDGRPFAKYINGEIIIRKLINSTAVKENRKGLEEGDDLTIEIEKFLNSCIDKVINEVQDKQREKERERSIQVSNEKISELNKFLRKCELNFKTEIEKLVPFPNGIEFTSKSNVEEDELEAYVRDTEEIISGDWLKGEHSGKGQSEGTVFAPNNHSDSVASVENGVLVPAQKRQSRKGLIVLMTDDPNSPVLASEYSEHEEPVIDRFLFSYGIILININNPIISRSRERKEQQYIFNERIANFILLVVAQYYTQKLLDSQPEEERDDWMLTSRKKFFDLQQDLREDKEISYFDDEQL